MRLYRYLEKQYADIFFDTGSIMLSSFERCRGFDDARGDPREGKANFLISSGTHVVAGINNAGSRTYLLCTSRLYSRDLAEKFNTDGCFSIRKPAHFAQVIRECISDVVSHHMGDCHYSDRGYETSTNEQLISLPPNLSNLSEDEIKAWFEHEHQSFSKKVNEKLGSTAYLTKRSSGYEEEREFRFFWTVATTVQPLLIITCPEARRYCSPETSPV